MCIICFSIDCCRSYWHHCIVFMSVLFCFYPQDFDSHCHFRMFIKQDTSLSGYSYVVVVEGFAHIILCSPQGLVLVCVDVWSIWGMLKVPLISLICFIGRWVQMNCFLIASDCYNLCCLHHKLSSNKGEQEQKREREREKEERVGWGGLRKYIYRQWLEGERAMEKVGEPLVEKGVRISRTCTVGLSKCVKPNSSSSVFS